MASSPYNRSWRKARLHFLQRNSLCVFCLAQNKVEPATVVDHKTPHRGDDNLFWDQANWQSLCKCCHDSAKQRLEKTGHLPGSDVQGMPLDAQHHWHKEATA